MEARTGGKGGRKITGAALGRTPFTLHRASPPAARHQRGLGLRLGRPVVLATGIELEEVDERLEQLWVAARERLRPLEEALDGHGEELGRVGGGVAAEHRAAAL